MLMSLSGILSLYIGLRKIPLTRLHCLAKSLKCIYAYKESDLTLDRFDECRLPPLCRLLLIDWETLDDAVSS